MKLIISIILVLTFSTISFSQRNQTYSHIPQGYPLPDSGIQTIPLSKMYKYESLKKKNIKALQEEKSKGYFEKEEPYANYLLGLKNHSAQEIETYKNNNDPYDTHLKKSISEIKLAFQYIGIQYIDQRNVIGFAALGSWKNGWTGVKEFFDDKNLGVCEFSKSNRSITHGGVQIAEEYARHDINNKPNILRVKGAKSTGFLYTLEWFDNAFNNELTCANQIYDKKIAENLIEIAKHIDSEQIENS